MPWSVTTAKVTLVPPVDGMFFGLGLPATIATSPNDVARLKLPRTDSRVAATDTPAPAERADLVTMAVEEDQTEDDSQPEAPMRAYEEKSDPKKELGARMVMLKAEVKGPLDLTVVLMPTENVIAIKFVL